MLEDADATPDWTSTVAELDRHTQEAHDATRDELQRKVLMDRDNRLLDRAMDTDARLRSQFTEKQTVTVVEGATSTTVETLYGVATGLPMVTATGTTLRHGVRPSNYTQNATTLKYTVTLNTPEAPVGGLEIDVMLTYAVARATAVVALV